MGLALDKKTMLVCGSHSQWESVGLGRNGIARHGYTSKYLHGSDNITLDIPRVHNFTESKVNQQSDMHMHDTGDEAYTCF